MGSVGVFASQAIENGPGEFLPLDGLRSASGPLPGPRLSDFGFIQYNTSLRFFEQQEWQLAPAEWTHFQKPGDSPCVHPPCRPLGSSNCPSIKIRPTPSNHLAQ